jgi:hypothetical protein
LAFLGDDGDERKRGRCGCRRARQRDFDLGIDPIYDAAGAKKNRKSIGLIFDRCRELRLPAFPGFKIVLVEPDLESRLFSGRGVLDTPLERSRGLGYLPRNAKEKE